MRLKRPRRRDGRTEGQGLVEFSLVLVPFLVLLMGCIDLGLGIYAMNGTSQAAREIARTTSVHLWDPSLFPRDLGSSSEAQDTIRVQRGLIPLIQFNPSTDITCVKMDDTLVDDKDCHSGDYVRVTVRAPYRPVTPLLSSFGTHIFQSYSRVQVP